MPELPPEYLAVVFIPRREDGEDFKITVELSGEQPKLFAGIRRGLQAAAAAH